MVRLLQQAPTFAEFFASCLLSQNIRLEEALTDQLLNSCEKRLARALLLMAGVGREGNFEATIPKLHQETLAEMIGTSRQRVNYFMRKFRRLGFVEYDGCPQHKLLVHGSLFDIVLKI